MAEEAYTSINSVPKFSALEFTNNNLMDIVRFIDENNIVVLHTVLACRVFHTIDIDKSAIKNFLENHRVIYIDCNSHPALLQNGEWDWYIKDSIRNVKELGYNDELREILINQNLVPHKVYLSLEY